MPEIRHLRTHEESMELRKLAAIAFDFTFDPEKFEPSEYDRPIDWGRGYFENGKMQAGMQIIPYKMRFDGNTVSMAGVGGVVSLPEGRRGGKIRNIFKEVFEEEYEKGTEFTMLAPFSHGFYRQFGYEVLSTRRKTIIQHNCFQKPSVGSFEQFESGSPTDVLEKIHTAYIANLNLAIPRIHRPDNLVWRDFSRNTPYKDKHFIYIWRDDDGNARSYVAFRRDGEGADKARMIIREIAFMDMEALRQIFTLFYLLRIKDVLWEGPMFVPVYDLFPEHWGIEEKLNPRDMGRVIHLERALTQMRRPAGEGSYVIDVKDSQIKGNNGRFQVEFGQEGTIVHKSRKSPDVIVKMPVLSQLIAGYRTYDDALLLRDDIESISNAETLRAVFTVRPTHLTENF